MPPNKRLRRSNDNKGRVEKTPQLSDSEGDKVEENGEHTRTYIRMAKPIILRSIYEAEKLAKKNQSRIDQYFPPQLTRKIIPEHLVEILAIGAHKGPRYLPMTSEPPE